MKSSADKILAAAIASTDPTERACLLLSAATELEAEGLTAKAKACRRLAHEEAAAAGGGR